VLQIAQQMKNRKILKFGLVIFEGFSQQEKNKNSGFLNHFCQPCLYLVVELSDV